MKLVLATKNPGKLAEITEILKELDFEVQSLTAYPEIGDIAEDGKTFIGNAIIKAATVARYTHQLVLADDSGLEVQALNGQPGIYSARYAKNDSERIRKLLNAMKDVPADKRQARFVCAIAIATSDGKIETVQETCEGIIGFEPKGTNGFGFDPVFYFPSLNKTFAELSRDEKAKYSHRGKALRKAKEILKTLSIKN
jgi:XTP/dITP diphosphohydrolase